MPVARLTLLWPDPLVLWLDTVDLFDHGPVIALQVPLGHWPSFTGMKHGAPYIRAVYMATGLVSCENCIYTGSSSLNFFQALLTVYNFQIYRISFSEDGLCLSKQCRP